MNTWTGQGQEVGPPLGLASALIRCEQQPQPADAVDPTCEIATTMRLCIDVQ